MVTKPIIRRLLFVIFPVIFITCKGATDGDGTEHETATINFFNESSFRVDLYKNLNPDYFDPTTLVCSINPGQTYKLTVHASADQVIGDTFYPRYKVLLADSLQTGTQNIYVDARRDLSNISFVVEKGKTYTKTIPNPQAGQLQFINGYLKIQNIGGTQIQIVRGDDILRRLDNDAVYLNTGQLGYFEIPFSVFDNNLTITLKANNGGSFESFPAFTMERGKLYSFTVNGSAVTQQGSGTPISY
jgi:hypothetical protein